MIRLANENDVEIILKIYQKAKQFLRENKNFVQWQGNYPSKELVYNDIKYKQLYVIEQDSIHGVFSLIFGDDPTYKIIKDGSWMSNLPYLTIHRVASDGIMHGIMKQIIEFSFTKCNHIRVDTYYKNSIMRNILIKEGFSERGIIFINDGSERIAYEKII